jgi:hypothetical protein
MTPRIREPPHDDDDDDFESYAYNDEGDLKTPFWREFVDRFFSGVLFAFGATVLMFVVALIIVPLAGGTDTALDD